jgi:hypothetical protein
MNLSLAALAAIITASDLTFGTTSLRVLEESSPLLVNR